MVSLTNTEAPPRKRQEIQLGYVPLIDCAPIIVARETGLFEKHKLSVKTTQQPGWATVREKLVHGELDASQCLGPLALAIHHGIGTTPREMIVPLVLSANGNGITLSNNIPNEVFSEKGSFLEFLEQNYTKDNLLNLAAVHPCSSHHSLLLLWLKKNRMANHPLINVISLPPETMLRSLANGHIDGFCVGEPWNSVAIQSEIGWCASNSVELSNGHPEKVLAATGAFAQSQPEALQALTLALLEACKFCQEKKNHPEILTYLAKEPGMDILGDPLNYSLTGRLPSPNRQAARAYPDFHIFYNREVNAPTSRISSWLRDGVRLSGLLQKEQQLPKDNIFRMDIFEEAQKQI